MSMPDDLLCADVAAIALRLRAAASDPSLLSVGALQQLLCAAVRLYGQKNVDGQRMRAFPEGGGGVTATDVMIATTAMLHAVNVQMFELGMWQAWTGAHSLHQDKQ
jgi:hypothetical protein